MSDAAQTSPGSSSAIDALPGGVHISATGQAQIIIYGDVVGGNKIVNVTPGSPLGDEVRKASAAQRPDVRRRPGPARILPRPFPNFLNRESESSAALDDLGAALPVEFRAPPGMGKTALLRHLGHHPRSSDFPDGVVYLPARRQPLADLLQSLFGAFFAGDAPAKPTQGEIRRRLQDIQALILLDDLDLARDELDVLLNAAPKCAFLLSSLTRALWGDGRSVALRGLPLDDALLLVEQELGRPLSEEERPSVETLWSALQGHPLHILQATALVRHDGRSLAEIARLVQRASPVDALTGELPAALGDSEERVLAALAAVGGASLDAARIAELSEVPDAPAVLRSLSERYLVEAHSPRYSMTGDLAQRLDRLWHLAEWKNRALDYFVARAAERQPSPTQLLEEADALLLLANWAVEVGRSAEALQLIQPLQSALAIGGRWGAWAQALQLGLAAARALNDRATEAWALHQLGTRSLCLGEVKPARAWLSRALQLRRAIGDRAGAAVTRNNLRLLPSPLTTFWRSAFGRWFLLGTVAAVAITLFVGLGGLGLWLCCLRPDLAPPTPVGGAGYPPSHTATFTATPTPSATMTPTPSPSDSVTLTPSWTHSPTRTRTPTSTPSPSRTPTRTATSTPTPSRTPTSTVTRTAILVALTPVADVYIYEGCPTCSYWTDTQLMVGHNTFSEFRERYWSLIRFDLSSIPPEATIVQATLAAYLFEWENKTPVGVELARVGAPWTEMGVTWNNKPQVPATWAGSTVDASSGVKEWDVTDLVQAWVGKNYPNYGLLLFVRSTESKEHLRMFYSREESKFEPLLALRYIP